MKKKPFVFSLLGVFVVLMSIVCCSSSNSKIGVVDIASVYENAEVFKSIRQEHHSSEEQWKTQALSEKEKLEKADKDLSKKKARMRRSQFDKEVTKLKNQILDFQNRQMAKLDLIRYQANQITAQVDEMMKPMIAQVAEDKKLEFVLSASNVLYHTKAVDITEDVIYLLDEAFEDGLLPELQIDLSEGE